MATTLLSMCSPQPVPAAEVGIVHGVGCKSTVPGVKIAIVNDFEEYNDVLKDFAASVKPEDSG